MKLKNPFSEETRLLYLYRYNCDNCGSNKMLELHHNIGRDSNSPLNAVLLCHTCHEHVKQNDVKLFNKNLQFLKSIDYKITPEDVSFMQHYSFFLTHNSDLLQWLESK